MKVQRQIGLFILIIISILTHAEIASLPGDILIGNVVNWTADYWSYVKTGHHLTSPMNERFGDTCYNERKYTNAIIGRVIQAIPQLSIQLSELSQIRGNRSTNLAIMLDKLQLSVSINDRLSNLVDKMSEINDLFNELTTNVRSLNIKNFNGIELCSFATSLIHDNMLSRKIHAIHSIIVPFRNLRDEWLANIPIALKPIEDTLCGTGHSPHDYLYSIYTSLILIEIEAYIMTAFSHNLLYNFNRAGGECHYNQNPNDAMSKVKKNVHKNIRDYNEIFIEQMKKASREFRSCDEEQKFIRDKTYFELEGLRQVTVIPLMPLSKYNCSQIPQYGSAAFCNPETQFCNLPTTRNCLGSFTQCWSGDIYIGGCLAPINSPRRYEFLQNFAPKYSFTGAEIPNDIPNCPEDRKMLTYGSCYCECLDNDINSQSTHLLNLRWVNSDVSKNMVITGIRFIVKHGVMQFQIQQGRLMSHFRVNENHWKPIKDISEAIHAARLKRPLHGRDPHVVENKDYLILPEESFIHLNTLNLSHNNVLTGVRFTYSPVMSGSDKKVINIQIKGQKLDVKTGKLCKKCTPEIIKIPASPVELYTYGLNNVEHPSFPTKPVSSTGVFTSITRSNMASDSGQTTLPYFDALPLLSDPPTPLGGLGIFHKTSGDFTGFLSLKFVSLDYSKYLEESIHELNEALESHDSPVEHSNPSKPKAHQKHGQNI